MLTVRSGTLFAKHRRLKKFTVKITHSIEGCERTDSENTTQLFVELKNC
jgi:hypothetical protein